ncbi:hypothetical protein [Bifidobacterium platyrrhinorum]|uniref:Uncharacterized protein n=1 Tax=Bifidobacterium platyrrhinorum TaxID=2661628 RepID=A0A6L9SS85_9BIFI|nr:hypothetical protein [Bifidobacterium platyrrhinorum]NEG55457.1 hypothetical protein [Bifidobacterium platyrrhinorum]
MTTTADRDQIRTTMVRAINRLDYLGFIPTRDATLNLAADMLDIPMHIVGEYGDVEYPDWYENMACEIWHELAA